MSGLQDLLALARLEDKTEEALMSAVRFDPVCRTFEVSWPNFDVALQLLDDVKEASELM